MPRFFSRFTEWDADESEHVQTNQNDTVRYVPPPCLHPGLATATLPAARTPASTAHCPQQDAYLPDGCTADNKASFP